MNSYVAEAGLVADLIEHLPPAVLYVLLGFLLANSQHILRWFGTKFSAKAAATTTKATANGGVPQSVQNAIDRVEDHLKESFNAHDQSNSKDFREVFSKLDGNMREISKLAERIAALEVAVKSQHKTE